ncbi:hypothetical protein MSAR_32750 [Mycolicibacterium sarraceniae]|uniref:Uncharacterized protein n=1 Tax=Mycolicibacterium sarraceniae TaxID=1534348 RepID=A0A7I7SVE3_9MYCO|nr:hypothetical protein MSAR_32750 [Mycolicibacterium sarraceniae]
MGVAVGECAGVPAAGFDEVVVGWAGQAEVVDIGVAAVFPVLGGVVDAAVVAGGVATRSGAAAVLGVQDDSLIGGGVPFGAAQP